MGNTFTVDRRTTRRSELLIGALVLLLTPCSVLRADDNGHSEDGDNENQYVVSKTPTAQCPHPQFTEIEQAVLAVPPGSTIRVCAGVYHLQVTISKPLTILGDTGAVLQPSSAAVNGTDFDNMGRPIIALLGVVNTHDVTINDLTVDGSTVGATLTSCGTTYVGVLYQNASGALTNMAVRNIKEAPVAQGCQSGLGIFVESHSGVSKVDISDSSVHDYQKNGITAKDAGTDVDIRHNYVSGIGSTPVIAQNGIEVAMGAMAEIENNFVDNHIYAPCTDPMTCTAAPTNIIVYNSNGISVTNNTAGTAQIGIYIQGNAAHVQGNNVWDNHVFDGIDLVGNNNQAQDNNIFHSDSDGVFVQGSNNQVTGNVINEAAIGVEVVAGPNNNVNGNKYYNVLVPTKDPAPKQIRVSPY